MKISTFDFALEATSFSHIWNKKICVTFSCGVNKKNMYLIHKVHEM